MTSSRLEPTWSGPFSKTFVCSVDRTLVLSQAVSMCIDSSNMAIGLPGRLMDPTSNLWPLSRLGDSTANHRHSGLKYRAWRSHSSPGVGGSTLVQDHVIAMHQGGPAGETQDGGDLAR